MLELPIDYDDETEDEEEDEEENEEEENKEEEDLTSLVILVANVEGGLSFYVA